MAAFLPFIGPLIEIGERIIDGILPEKMSEKDKEDAKLKMRVQAFNELSSQSEDIQNARKMAMKEMETDVWIVRLLRGLVRPVTGFTFVGMYVWSKVSIQFGYKAIALTQNDYIIIGGIMAFYFGMRSFVDKKNGVSQ